MFAPEALRSINKTYDAKRLTLHQVKRRAKGARAPWNAEEAVAAAEAGKQIVEVDGDLMTEDELEESYTTCEHCGKLCYREPLTWGVTQYKTLQGSDYCNEHYAEEVVRMLDENSLANWPVHPGEKLTFEIFRQAIEHRTVEDALRAAGWEIVDESGTEQEGKSAEDVHRQFAAAVAADPAREYVVTVLAWQFCQDVTLWSRTPKVV